MAPSIWGPHANVKCHDCQIQWLANWQPAYRPQSKFRCWNCGSWNTADQVEVVSADHVVIDPDAYRDHEPQPNDVVAIHDSQGWRLKRIAARPGDIVEMGGDNVLRINGQPLSSTAPWVIVHDDRHRGASGSWWRSDSQFWQTTLNGFTAFVKHPTDAVLIYHHRSVYDALKADRIRDDCIFNLNENRELRPVQRLAIEMQIDSKENGKVEVWFQNEEVRCQTLEVKPGRHLLMATSDQATPYDQAADLPSLVPVQLDAYHPIVVRLVQVQAHLSYLLIKRPIEYWIDPTNLSTTRLPISLSADQYFVVGDNVPLSIDSRYTGAVSKTQIRGKVIKVVPGR